MSNTQYPMSSERLPSQPDLDRPIRWALSRSLTSSAPSSLGAKGCIRFRNFLHRPPSEASECSALLLIHLALDHVKLAGPDQMLGLIQFISLLIPRESAGSRPHHQSRIKRIPADLLPATSASGLRPQTPRPPGVIQNSNLSAGSSSFI